MTDSLTMSAQQSSTSGVESRQKTTLFCPSCDHESDVTGDWKEYTENNRRIYDCPICDTTITKRLRDASPMAPND